MAASTSQSGSGGPSSGRHGGSRVAIIGAGPIGIELHVALAASGQDVVHYEAGALGDTVAGYPHRVQFFSSPERIQIAGQPLQTAAQRKASREEYLDYLRSVVIGRALLVRTHERVLSIEKQTGGFLVQSQKGATEREETVDHVVVAFGDMHERRTLGLPGEDLPHVQHRLFDPHEFCGERLMIIGGRNSAVESALRCHRAGANVSISYRRGAFLDDVKPWIRSDIVNQIRAGEITLYANSVPHRFTSLGVELEPHHYGDDDLLEGATVLETAAEIEVDAVLVLVGFEQDKSLFRQLGCELEGANEAPVFDERTMETTVPGVFVAGTAAAGTQREFSLFIENCHPHIDAICRKLTGQPAPFPTSDTSRIARGLPES